MSLTEFEKQMVHNATLTRAALLAKLSDEHRDLDREFRYPDTISLFDYWNMYERFGLAEMVVDLLPLYCWKQSPMLLETTDEDITEFEQAWMDLNKKRQLDFYMSLVDRLSGIGYYGLLLFGIDDGEDLSRPINGFDEEELSAGSQQHQLIYMRAFSNHLIRIAEIESNPTSMRFGKPIRYTIDFSTSGEAPEEVGVAERITTVTVHWHRVMHVAENLINSNIFAKPRLKSVYNHLLDVKKVTGGSAEMFYRGAFPGIAFEVHPELTDVTMDKQAVREEMHRYSEGLQRYLAITGVSAKSLPVQVASPKEHLDSLLRLISAKTRIPMRILLGTEQGVLAGDQDGDQMDDQTKTRRALYLGPRLIVPSARRLVAMGVLPEPQDELFVVWDDPTATKSKDQADVAKVKVEACKIYIEGNVDALIPKKVFLTRFLDFDDETAESIIEESENLLEEMEREMEDANTDPLEDDLEDDVEEFEEQEV